MHIDMQFRQHKNVPVMWKGEGLRNMKKLEKINERGMLNDPPHSGLKTYILCLFTTAKTNVKKGYGRIR